MEKQKGEIENEKEKIEKQKKEMETKTEEIKKLKLEVDNLKSKSKNTNADMEKKMNEYKEEIYQNYVEIMKSKGEIKRKQLLLKKQEEKNVTAIKEIPILMATDEGYIYPTLVSMASVCMNKLNTTKLNYTIFVPVNFTSKNKNVLKIIEKYFHNCFVQITEMGNQFDNAPLISRLSTAAYFRLSSPTMFPHLNKLLWLDSDTLIYGDISGLYDIDMADYYFRGLYDPSLDLERNFKVKTNNYICTGIMLMNLTLLRENDIESKCLDFIKKNKKFDFADQSVINYVCRGKLEGLPYKYCGFVHPSENNAVKWLNGFKNYRKKYSVKEVKEGYKQPIIVHQITPYKPWKYKMDTIRVKKDLTIINTHIHKFWEFASYTEFFDEILKMSENK